MNAKYANLFRVVILGAGVEVESGTHLFWDQRDILGTSFIVQVSINEARKT
jgi:hypothetical protein